MGVGREAVVLLLLFSIQKQSGDLLFNGSVGVLIDGRAVKLLHDNI